MRLLLALLSVVSCATLASAQDGKIPLKTELPKPVLVGTPVPIKLPNLEPAPAEPARLLVPAGTTNLAAGKPVTASDNEPLLGDLTLLTDGDKSADEGCFTEFGPGKQWVQIDLEKTATLYGVWLWHFHSQSRAYLDVVVQASDDADFLQGVATLYNNDHDNSSGLGTGKDYAYLENHRGRLIPFPESGIKARYVRLYSAGNTSNKLNHYIEVEVFGTP